MWKRPKFSTTNEGEVPHIDWRSGFFIYYYFHREIRGTFLSCIAPLSLRSIGGEDCIGVKGHSGTKDLRENLN